MKEFWKERASAEVTIIVEIGHQEIDYVYDVILLNNQDGNTVIEEITCCKYWINANELLSEQCSGPHSNEQIMDLIDFNTLRWE